MAENMILTRLEGVKARFDEVGQLITDPAVIGDMKRYVKLNREYKQLEPVIHAFDAYRNLLSNIDSAKEILSEEKDEELREMAKEEMELYAQQLNPLEEEIKLLLLPRDPEDDKDAIVEIRAGT
ncbi:MAG: PCRF domain-containing protein, partial [Bacteroidales bacterium]|nr:PCRF domain-containing protein [Bacteroidales bacterium]